MRPKHVTLFWHHSGLFIINYWKNNNQGFLSNAGIIWALRRQNIQSKQLDLLFQQNIWVCASTEISENDRHAVFEVINSTWRFSNIFAYLLWTESCPLSISMYHGNIWILTVNDTLFGREYILQSSSEIYIINSLN